MEKFLVVIQMPTHKLYVEFYSLWAARIEAQGYAQYDDNEGVYIYFPATGEIEVYK